MSIGENIKSLRESRGLTKAQLGAAECTYSDFEKFMIEAYRRMDAEQRAFLRAALVGTLTGRAYVGS